MAETGVTTEQDELWDLMASYLDAEEIELDDLEVSGGAGGRIIRVVIDAEGGVGVDRIAQSSRALSRLLDDRDPIDGAYTLEVTSPGLERKLRRPRHYQKSIGRTVTIKTKVEIETERRHDGTLRAVDESGLELDIDGSTRRIEFDDVASARTVFEWKPKPKPGRKSE